MKLGVAAATQIAAFICGDEGLPFPYRSGRAITNFFTGMGHGFRIDDYSSRAKLAENAMIKIDLDTGDENSDVLSPEIVEIIEELMSPIAFEADTTTKSDYNKSLKLINRVLKRLSLEVVSIGGRPVIQTSDGVMASTASASVKSVSKLIFAPSVFQVPDDPDTKDDLVSVMMPFESSFEGVFRAINKACGNRNLRCLRVKDIWKETQIIQDVFELILASRIVIVDFSKGNTNVFYEAGIAHTLGKEVIPLAQSVKNDVPFDLQSHRVIEYLNNGEGLDELTEAITKRLRTIVEGHDWASVTSSATEEDCPF